METPAVNMQYNLYRVDLGYDVCLLKLNTQRQDGSSSVCSGTAHTAFRYGQALRMSLTGKTFRKLGLIFVNEDF